MERIPTGDILVDLLSDIDDAETELEELLECGDLEDILECQLKIEELKAAHFRASLAETDRT
jgi:hypothetical protein